LSLRVRDDPTPDEIVDRIPNTIKKRDWVAGLFYEKSKFFWCAGKISNIYKWNTISGVKEEVSSRKLRNFSRF